MKFKKYIFIVLGILALSVFVTILSTVFVAFFEIINNIIGTEPVIEATPKLSLTVFGVSISIKLRTNFIKINDKDYRKSIVQIFRISAPVFTIILSFVGLYAENIAYYILLINAISAIHVLYVNLRNREHTLLD